MVTHCSFIICFPSDYLFMCLIDCMSTLVQIFWQFLNRVVFLNSLYTLDVLSLSKM